MGKRKSSSRKPAKKIKQTLDTTFTCLFCNHEKSVICTIDKKNLLGELHCKICGQSFQTAIHSLSQPVDIYSDWIDACEDLAEEAENMVMMKKVTSTLTGTIIRLPIVILEDMRKIPF